MSAEVQLEIWAVPYNRQQAMAQEMDELKQKQNNLRRGLFFRFGEISKEVALLREEIADLKEDTNVHKKNSIILI